MQVSKRNQQAIEKAKKHGVKRFQISANDLEGCYFTLPLDQLVDEESFLDEKICKLAQRKSKGEHVDANRLLAATHDLTEIQFCLGLFAIASNSEELFDVSDETTAEDIYLQLMDEQVNLPVKDKDILNEAQHVMNKAGVVLQGLGKMVGTINRFTYSVGVSASKGARKGSKKGINNLGKGLNNFGKWLEKNTK